MTQFLIDIVMFLSIIGIAVLVVILIDMAMGLLSK
jgi:hypothetical protein